MKKKKSTLARVESQVYMAAVANGMGWCITCRAFTRRETEPDAYGYVCPLCHEKSVIGAETGVVEARFMIVKRDPEVLAEVRRQMRKLQNEARARFK